MDRQLIDSKLIKNTINTVREDLNAQDAEIQKKMEEQAKEEYAAASSPFVYKYSIVILGVLALTAAVAGVIVLILDPTGVVKVPESLVAIGSASVGALVGIFAPTPKD